jgi:hypothetical protein
VAPRRLLSYSPEFAPELGRESDPHFNAGQTNQSECLEHLLPTASPRIDTRTTETNNPRMNKPEIVRRIKTYSAETGTVYQYQFNQARAAGIEGQKGQEYLYYVTADRKAMHPVRVLVSREGIQKWGATSGRSLNGTEEYAVAKMRLFQGFDEVPNLEKLNAILTVDETNVGALLEKLDL